MGCRHVAGLYARMMDAGRTGWHPERHPQTDVVFMLWYIPNAPCGQSGWVLRPDDDLVHTSVVTEPV